MTTYKKHESGRSMIEMIGVLSVMGLITAGAFVLMRSGMSSQKRNRVQDEIGNIATLIRASSASLPDFSNLPKDDEDCWYKLGPQLLDSFDVQTATPLGGGAFYTVCGKDTVFIVRIMKIEEKDCVSLANMGWSEGKAACDMESTGSFMVTYGK